MGEFGALFAMSNCGPEGGEGEYVLSGSGFVGYIERLRVITGARVGIYVAVMSCMGIILSILALNMPSSYYVTYKTCLQVVHTW